MTEHFEPVLLIAPNDDGTENVRTVAMRRPGIVVIVERQHVHVDTHEAIEEHTWYNFEGERALSGQRIFREIRAKDMPSAGECPARDEMLVRIPLVDAEFNRCDAQVRRDLASPDKKVTVSD